MTDDRTEQRLRRALQDAARHIDVPMGALPEPTTEPTPVRRRPRVPVPAAIALALLLVAGSVAVIAARDDSSNTVGVGAAYDGQPITRENADIQLSMDVDATPEQIDAVRAFAEASPEIAAYTYVNSQNLFVEYRALCMVGPTSPQFPPAFRFRVASVEDDQALARALVSLPGVTQVASRSDRTSVAASPETVTTDAVATTTEVPSPTIVVAPTVAPAAQGQIVVVTPTTLAPEPATTALPTTTTTPPEEPPSTAPASKEVPWSAPAQADCSETSNGHGSVQAAPAQPTETLPPEGDQPVDAEAARTEIIDMWIRNHDGSVPIEQRIGFIEDGEELLALTQQAAVGKEATISQIRAKVFNVVFTSPTRAAVEWQNTFTGGGTDIRQVSYAVLIDGVWKMSRESQCKAIARANVHCPEGP